MVLITNLNSIDLKLGVSKIWDMVYLNLIPSCICAYCNKKIDNLNDWVSFTCECKFYYHKIDCTLKSINSNTNGVMNCPKCSNSYKKIYTAKTFMRKFVNKTEYFAIFLNTIENMSKCDKLNVYNIMYIESDMYTEPLLNLIEYHEPNTKFIEFDKFIKDNDKLYYFENTNMKNTAMDIIDMNKFKNKIIENSYNLIGDDFIWNNTVVLAGGMVHKCMANIENIPEYSDFDIFIVNNDINILTNEIKRVIKYFQNRFGDNTYWVVRRHVINIYVVGYNRSIQLMIYQNDDIANIISKFDFTHTQFVYNGKNILTTYGGLNFANTGITIHDDCYELTYPKRLYKAKELKLCIALTINKVLNTPIAKVSTLDYWFPTYSDDNERIIQQLKYIYHIDKKYISKAKPIKIYYSKMPREFIIVDNNHLTDGEIITYVRN